jgi:transcriptional regulator with XRE-family HTH domain
MADSITAFGRRLQERRDELGMSQKEMADRLERSVEWLCRLERGKIEPPHNLELMYALAINYEIKPGVLLISAGFMPVLDCPICVSRPEAVYDAIVKVQQEAA